MTKLVTSTILFLLAGTGLASAQSGGSFDLSWHSVDGGGDSLSGGGYSLEGTIGQPEADPPIAGGNYSLGSGLWSIVVESSGSLPTQVFLPIVVKGY